MIPWARSKRKASGRSAIGPPEADGRVKTTEAAVKRRWHEVELLLVSLLVAGVIVGVGMHPKDLSLYQHYARLALRRPLFRSLPKEYPALALLIFLVPRILPVFYPVVFAVVAAGVGVVLVLSTDGVERWPGWSRRVCTYLLLASVAVVFARYDVFAVLTMVLAVEGARHGRWGRAWSWGVLGGLLKLFPFLLLPGFLVLERVKTGKWALRRPLVSLAPVALVGVGQSLLSPGSVLRPVRYELHRGLELSSVQGSLSFLLDPVHAQWVSAFGSIEVLGTGRAFIGVLFSAAAIAALVGIWALGFRGRLGVEAVSLAVLSVAVFSDKAFGAQYLMWLIPLWAYWPLRKGWLAAAALTTLIYPVLYAEAPVWGPGYYLPTGAAVIRNGVLIATTAFWLWEQVRTPRVMASADGPGIGADLVVTGAIPAHSYNNRLMSIWLGHLVGRTVQESI